MTLSPLLAAPMVVQLHAMAAMTALGLGAVQLARRKGDGAHRLVGRIWVGLMAAIALSSFWITGVAGKGHWSWIHIISAVTLVTLGRAVIAARNGQIAAHRRAMLALFWIALILTGAFTLIPGRLMGAVVFGW